MAAESFGATSLPRTVAARRNARLRAAALATIPLILFVLAALPRVWAPDLVPLDSWEAAYIAEARAHSVDSWAQAYADPTWPALALADPWLRALPSPVAGWVVVRGLLDALGVALLYLAVRPLVGTFGATMAGALYAASPVAWAAARDPAGSLGPVLGAASLLAAVSLVERPTLLRGAVLGVALGLLTRSLPLGLLVVVLGAVTLASARADWRTGGLTALALVLTAGPSLFLPLARLYNVPLPPNVAETFSLVSSPLVPLLMIGAAVALLRHSNAKVGVLFAAIWMCVGVLGGDWLWRTSARTIVSGVLLDDLMRVPGHSHYFLACAVTVVALAVSHKRVARWCGRLAALLAVVALMAGTAIDMRYDAEAERSTPPFTLGGGYSAALQGTRYRPTGSLFISPSLREVTAVTDALEEAAGRAGTREIVLLNTRLDPLLTQSPSAVGLDNLQTRSVGTAMVLPLERETVYLTSAINPEAEEPWLPVEAQRPSSSVSIFTPGGADTGARIVTIRSRPVADWLARIRAVADGRFADGSVLLGVYREPRTDGTLDLTLYWQIPAAADGRSLGARAQVLVDGAPPPNRFQIAMPVRRALGMPPGSASFPAVEARRGGELVVQVIRLEVDSGRGRTTSLGVAVFDDRNQPVRTVAGEADLALPSGP